MASSLQQGKPPYSVHMDPGVALDLVKQGASLLILDMPPHAFLGFDLQILSLGPLFKGIKMIPPGPHFVYYSSTGSHGFSQSFFTGFFIHPCPGEVIVRRWDAGTEMLVKLSDSDEEERYRIAVRNLEFDRHLGAYDIHHYQSWKRLTGHLNPRVIERFKPVGEDISVIHEADFADTQTQTLAERRLHQHLKESREIFTGRTVEARGGTNPDGQSAAFKGISMNVDGNRVGGSMDDHTVVVEDTSMDVDGGTLVANCVNTDGHRVVGQGTRMDVDGGKKPTGRCFYTQFPHLVKRPGISGSKLTMLNVDKSSELESLLKCQYEGSEDLLGELEFSFIAFMMGQSLESFSQWKSIVCLMLSCDEAPLSKHTQLFVKFLEIVCSQLQTGLKSGPSDPEMPFMDDTWFSDDNFLRSRFKEFYQLVTEAQPVDGDLLKQTRRLKGILESSLGWILDIEEGDITDDEYAPVIVPEAELTGYH